LDTSNHVRIISRPYNLGSWSNFDLTAASGAPNAHPNHPPIGYVRADGYNVVISTAADGHIWEISQWGSSWNANDLTQITGGTVALSNVRPYSRSDGVSAIVYIDHANSVRELSLSPGGTWVSNPIAAAPAAKHIRPYVRSDGYNVIVHQNPYDGDIRQLIYANNTWSVTNLTQTASPAPAPAADSNKPASGYVRTDKLNTIVYQAATTGHIIELALYQGAWVWNDLGAP
jgi:hypothetical protein